MNNKIKIGLVIIIFAGGWILGSNNNTAPVITSSMGGASYSGGYQPEAQAGVQAEGAVALRLMVDRFDTVERTGDVAVNDPFVLRGLTTLPIRWTVRR